MIVDAKLSNWAREHIWHRSPCTAGGFIGFEAVLTDNVAGANSGERCISCEHAIGEGEREQVVVVKELLGEVGERMTLERLCLGEARTDGLWKLAAVAAACVRRVCWCLTLKVDGFDEAWT